MYISNISNIINISNTSNMILHILPTTILLRFLPGCNGRWSSDIALRFISQYRIGSLSIHSPTSLNSIRNTDVFSHNPRVNQFHHMHLHLLELVPVVSETAWESRVVEKCDDASVDGVGGSKHGDRNAV